jgi:hypothetical protein
MREKTKKIDVGGVWYQTSRFDPKTGTHILMRIIGTIAKAQSERRSVAQAPPDAPPEKQLSGEEIARTICSAAFIAGLDEEFGGYVQDKCLARCARVEASGLPMPIANAAGLLPDVADDFGLILRLMIETLTFNYTDFFGQGGSDALGIKP